jgi:FMN phosphatase YigB (HAD superfamily)
MRTRSDSTYGISDFSVAEFLKRDRLTASAPFESVWAKAEIVSLDVFDTVLTRSCGAPEALYLWLGRRLWKQGLIACTPEVFAHARTRAEKQVWQRAGGMDSCVYVIDFYREVVRWLWMEAADVEMLTDAELRLEQEVLRSMPLAVRLIEAAATSGKRIIFTSDTYFPGAFIEKQLRSHGVWNETSLCIASSDECKSKASGKLFDVMLKKVQAPAKNVVHFGDNPHSDVLMPRLKGIKNQWLPEGRLNRYEKILCDYTRDTDGLSAAFAGASRLARLSVPVTSTHARVLRDVTAGVAAPILVGYVLWLLSRAVELGLSRLYFLSRDGQILHEIARLLAQRLELPIQMSYLYASRQSTNLAATYNADDEELTWVFRDMPGMAVEAFLSRFDLTYSEVSAELSAVGLGADARIEPAQCRAIRNILQSVPIRKLILDRAARRRTMVAEYLKQEGLLEGSRSGIIDFGGAGSQVRALHTLLIHHGQPAPHIFLIGLDTLKDNEQLQHLSVPDNPQWLRDTECYLYDHRRQLGVKRQRGFGTCVQMFCAADHHTVTGYSRQGDAIVPEGAIEMDKEIMAWGLDIVRQTLRSFTEHITLDSSVVNLKADMREPACQTIKVFWSDPSRDEAEAWGQFPFEGAEAGGNMKKILAYRYSLSYVICKMAQHQFPDLGWQHWYEGSLVMSSRPLRIMLRAAERLYRRSESASHFHGKFAVKAIRYILGRS